VSNIILNLIGSGLVFTFCLFFLKDYRLLINSVKKYRKRALIANIYQKSCFFSDNDRFFCIFALAKEKKFIACLV